MRLEKLLYSKTEAAEIVGLSKRDIGLGRIEVRHYGRQVLIPQDEHLRIAAQGMRPEPVR